MDNFEKEVKELYDMLDKVENQYVKDGTKNPDNLENINKKMRVMDNKYYKEYGTTLEIIDAYLTYRFIVVLKEPIEYP